MTQGEIMRIALPIAALLMAGCAAQPSLEEARHQMIHASAYQVCRAALLAPGNWRAAANEEIERRRPDCSPYMASIQLEAQQRQVDLASGLMLMQAAQPRPMPMPALNPSVICTSRAGAGGTATTSCQ
jgi:hypothetical protein